MTDQRDSQTVALSALLDRDSIRRALLRYCRGVDRADHELIASVFHLDAVIEHGDFTLNGSEVADVLIKATAGHDPNVHQITNHTIELAGDVAFSESYFTAYVVFVEGEQEILTTRVGRYIDRFSRRNGEWRIEHRRVIVEFDWSDRGPERPGQRSSAGKYISGKRSKEDISYER